MKTLQCVCGAGGIAETVGLLLIEMGYSIAYSLGTNAFKKAQK
jgi:hypothetical protein